MKVHRFCSHLLRAGVLLAAVVARVQASGPVSVGTQATSLGSNTATTNAGVAADQLQPPAPAHYGWPLESTWLKLPLLPDVNYLVIPVQSLSSATIESVQGLDDNLGLAVVMTDGNLGYLPFGLANPVEYPDFGFSSTGINIDGWSLTYQAPVQRLTPGGELVGQSVQYTYDAEQDVIGYYMQATGVGLVGTTLVPLANATVPNFSMAVGGNRLGHLIVREVDGFSGGAETYDNNGNDLGYTSIQTMVYTGSLWTGGDTAGTPLLGSVSYSSTYTPDMATTYASEGSTLDPRFLNDQDMVAGYRINAANLGWPFSSPSLANATTAVLDTGGWHLLGYGLALYGLTSAVTTSTTLGTTSVTLTLAPAVAYGVDADNNLWWAHQPINQYGTGTAWVKQPLRVVDPAAGTNNPVNPNAAFIRVNDRLEMIVGDNRVIRNGTFLTLDDRITPGWRVTDTRDINHSGVILADATRTNLAATQPVLLVPLPALRVDSNSDGIIDANDPLPTASQPFQHWLNDGINGTGQPNYASSTVNGTGDLRNYFPVFLDLQNFVGAMPPSQGYTYWLSQDDEALDFVYSNLTEATAFAYRTSTATSGYGTNLLQAAGAADKVQVTADGVALDRNFLEKIATSSTGQGVLLFEGRTWSVQPLVLTVYDIHGNYVMSVALQLSLGARILLLLHGMNSSTITAWDDFVRADFGGSSQDIVNGDFYPLPSSPSPMTNALGVRCYRLQFGHYDNVSMRTGLENLTVTNAKGWLKPNKMQILYLSNNFLKCGDFETFDELGQEVDDAITRLRTRFGSNAEIVLLGHSRGGIAARAFLQSSSTNRSSVGALLTTSSPHQGSPLLWIYAWLGSEFDPATGQRAATPASAVTDWTIVDGLRNHAKVNLDLRRPVIGDLAEGSSALNNLNSAIANLPHSIRYGEITNSGVPLGTLAIAGWTGLEGFSVFDGKTILGISALPEPAAQNLLAPYYPTIGSSYKTAAEMDYTGDGCVPVTSQRFTTIAGFIGTVIPPLTKNDGTIVHIDAPHRSADLISQLKVLVPGWFP